MNILDVTIDLETCSLSTNAAVIQVAACAWNRNREETPLLFNGQETFFNMPIDLRSCIAHGMDFDKETLKWWANKDDATKESVLYDHHPYEVEMIGDRLGYFIKHFSENFKFDKICLWSQGTDFDIAILRNIARQTGYPDLFNLCKHNDVRDARTYILEMGSMALFGDTNHTEKEIYEELTKRIKLPNDDGVSGLSPHDARFDVLRTTYNVWYIMQELKKKISI